MKPDGRGSCTAGQSMSRHGHPADAVWQRQQQPPTTSQPSSRVPRLPGATAGHPTRSQRPEQCELRLAVIGHELQPAVTRAVNVVLDAALSRPDP